MRSATQSVVTAGTAARSAGVGGLPFGCGVTGAGRASGRGPVSPLSLEQGPGVQTRGFREGGVGGKKDAGGEAAQGVAAPAAAPAPPRVNRPMSAHLTVYKTQWTSLYSIMTRITGVAVYAAGLGFFFVGAFVEPMLLHTPWPALNLTPRFMVAGWEVPGVEGKVVPMDWVVGAVERFESLLPVEPDAFYSAAQSALVNGTMSILIGFVAYHAANGRRHMKWDNLQNLPLEQARKSGNTMMAKAVAYYLAMMLLYAWFTTDRPLNMTELRMAWEIRDWKQEQQESAQKS